MHQLFTLGKSWWNKLWEGVESHEPVSPAKISLQHVPVHTNPPLLRVHYPSHLHTLYTKKTWTLLPEDHVVIGEHTCRFPLTMESVLHLEPNASRSIKATVEGLSLLGGSFVHTRKSGVQPAHRNGLYTVCGEEPLTYPESELYAFISSRRLASKAEILRQFVRIDVISSAVRLTKQDEKLYRSVKERDILRVLHNMVDKVILRVAHTPLIVQVPFAQWDKRSFEDSAISAIELVLEEETCSFSPVMNAVVSLRETTGKPIGIRVHATHSHWVERLSSYLDTSSDVPDFITVEDHYNQPLFSALLAFNEVLTTRNVRQSLTLIANGIFDKTVSQGTALSCGADLISMKTNAFTHRHQAADRLADMRHDLFTLASQYELASPVFFSQEQLEQQKRQE